MPPDRGCGNALAARADCGMLWSQDTARLSVARSSRSGRIDVPGPPTHVQKGQGSWWFLQDPFLQERPQWPVFPVPRRGSSGSRSANSPRMESVSVMRRKIAVGMLGLALAGCAQSRSSMPGAASHGQPIGMEPVPSISDTINRGTGDPAIVQATLPDPKNPNWSGEFTPPLGPARTPPGPQVARSGQVQGSASSPIRRPYIRPDLRRSCVALESAASQCHWTARWRRHTGPRRGPPGGSSTDRPAGTDCAFTAARDGRP